MKRRVASTILNIAIAVAVIWAWLAMMFRFENGLLSSRGWASLKYFTVLSNLLQAAASAAYVIAALRSLARGGGGIPRGVALLKYAAAVSVSLTFLTVMLFLGPVFGYGGMFAGSNLFFHLLVPLAAAFDFCTLDREGTFSLRDSLIAVVPMLLYGAGYVLNILVNGVTGNDWYGFAAGGVETFPLVFAAMALATWGVALILRLPRRAKR